VGVSVLANDAELASLPWVLDQLELLHLLAYLDHVPAKEASGFLHRPAVAISLVKSLIPVSDPGSPELASIGCS
jgi:hypothetical protein